MTNFFIDITNSFNSFKWVQRWIKIYWYFLIVLTYNKKDIVLNNEKIF